MKRYIFLFYNKSQGVPEWVPLHKDFRHCDYLLLDGNTCTMFSFNRKGVQVGRRWASTPDEVMQAINNIDQVSAYITLVKSYDYHRRWFPFQLRLCQEMSRIMTGLDIPLSLTPYGLYKKLLKYDCKRNYQILTHWSATDGDRSTTS